jgi:hypothetical protein
MFSGITMCQERVKPRHRQTRIRRHIRLQPVAQIDDHARLDDITGRMLQQALCPGRGSRF